MRLIALLAVVMLPASAPSARPILFTVAGVNGPDVVVDAPHGGDRLSLTGGHQASAPAWSPDGSRIAFGATLEPPGHGGVAIYVAAPDGSGLTRVTTDQGTPGGPAWSPDGTSIAYIVDSAGSFDIWTVDLATGRQRRITTDGVSKSGLGWSPDGTTLLYDEQSFGDAVAAVPAAGGEVRILARGLGAVWAPHDERIAYVDGHGIVAVMNADGTASHELTKLASNAPSWSPDGRSVLFTAGYPETTLPYSRYTGPEIRTDIYTAPADGSFPPRRLTGPFDPLRFAEREPQQPAYSPDGQRIFYRVGDGDVWSLNTDGTCDEPWVGLGRTLGGTVLWQPGYPVGATSCVDLSVGVAPDRYDVALNRQALVHATIENHGNLPATGVVLRVAAVRRSEKTFGCPQAGCHVGAIPPGGSVTIDVFAADGKTGLSGVSVTASAREPDPTPEDARGAGQFVVLNCTEVGTAGADFLPGRPGDDRICGLPGPDWISGGKGDDHLDGGNGDDTIYGGPGHDTILGGGGRDVIFARDGERDRIDCGSEYDVAVVDKIDQVGHCERVLRK